MMSNELKAKEFTDFFDWFNQSDYKYVPDDVKTAMLDTWSVCVNNIPDSLLQRLAEPHKPIARDDLVEMCAEAVHKAYCDYYKINHGEEYWTRGDYNLLDETTKQIDRETVKAVLSICEEGNQDE